MRELGGRGLLLRLPPDGARVAVVLHCTGRVVLGDHQPPFIEDWFELHVG